MNCPDHGVPLQKNQTKFGDRWRCPTKGCTMVWWGKEGVLPANDETRAARKWLLDFREKSRSKDEFVKNQFQSFQSQIGTAPLNILKEIIAACNQEFPKKLNVKKVTAAVLVAEKSQNLPATLPVNAERIFELGE